VSSQRLGKSLTITINCSARSGLAANTYTLLLVIFSNRLVNILIPSKYGLLGDNDVIRSVSIGRVLESD